LAAFEPTHFSTPDLLHLARLRREPISGYTLGALHLLRVRPPTEHGRARHAQMQDRPTRLLIPTEDEVPRMPRHALSDLVDLTALRGLLERFCDATDMPIAVLDADGEVLIAKGWQDICTRFHRVHPTTSARCRESDAYIKSHLSTTGPVAYKCRNGLWDVAVPVIVNGEHIATLFVGQFHYEGETLDEELFRRQAREFGFDEAEYVDALRRVPVFHPDRVHAIMDHFADLATMLSETGLTNLELTHLLAEHRRTEDALRRRERELLEAQRVASMGSWSFDPSTQQPEWSDEAFRIVGIEPGPVAPSYDRHREFIHPEDWPAFDAAISAATDRAEPYELEMRVLRPGGETRHVVTRGEADLHADGSVARLHGTIQDITDRKLAEARRERTTEGLHAVVALAADLIGCPNADALLRRAVFLAHSRLGLSRCAILLADGNRLLGTYAVDAAGEIVDDKQRSIAIPDAWVRGSDPGATRGARWETCDPRLWPCIDADPASSEWVARTPIRAGETLVGVMCNVVGPTADAADGAQQDIAAVLCSLLGALIERDRMQGALRASEERLRRVIATANEGIWSAGPDGRTTFANRRIAEMLGYTPDELLGRPVEQFMPADQAADHRRQFEARRAGRSATYERRFTHRDGHAVTMLVSASPMLGADGSFEGSLAMLTDITDRKRAEDELRDSRETAWALLNATSQVAFLLDPNLRVVAANDASARSLGAAPEALIGRPVSDCLPLEVAEAAAGTLSDVVASGRGERLQAQSEGRHLLLAASPISSPRGNVTKVALFIQDMTDVKRAEDSQRLAAIGQLAAGVAHEFNNLLAGMMMRAERAGSLSTLEEYERLADLVLRSSSRGADICRNLTAFARPRAPARTPGHIEDPIEAALAVAARHIEVSEVLIRRSYATEGRRINADAGQLEQVFLNLIINACHAMPSGGRLTVSTRVETDEAGAAIVAAVADTGVGITSDNLPRVFEPFFTTKGLLGQDDTPGTGLGLSVSHGIVAAHGGTLTVASQLGVGTTFELRLAAHDRQADPEVAQPTPAVAPLDETPSHRGPVVLWADDEPDLREVLAQALEEHGLRVVSAADATQACAQLSARGFDLVIADLLMPGGGGRAVLAAAREASGAPPVIVLTGRAEPHIAAELVALGATECLAKPATTADVLAAVDRIIAPRRA